MVGYNTVPFETDNMNCLLKMPCKLPMDNKHKSAYNLVYYVDYFRQAQSTNVDSTQVLTISQMTWDPMSAGPGWQL